MTMTPRQRWRAVLSGGTPDRHPCDYWATREVTARLMRELNCPRERALWERLGADRLVRLGPIHRRTGEDDWHLQSQYKAWQVGTRQMPYGDGIGVYEESVAAPLAAAASTADVERFGWPNPDDWDVSGLPAACHEFRDYPLVAGCYEPFYLYCRLRGMEQALEDLVVNPGIADAILERIHFIHQEVVRRILREIGDHIDFIYVAEDLGTQQSLLMSPATFRRFLKLRLRGMIDLAHSFGVRAFHHNDGAIRPLIPELIEIGIDVLNPIQWRCAGMEREGLARDFGSALVFHGAIDNQQTLPFGSPNDVRREVVENLRIFRRSRGYIVGPCHNIQANTPTENILALYDAIREYGAQARD